MPTSTNSLFSGAGLSHPVTIRTTSLIGSCVNIALLRGSAVTVNWTGKVKVTVLIVAAPTPYLETTQKNDERC